MSERSIFFAAAIALAALGMAACKNKGNTGNELNGPPLSGSPVAGNKNPSTGGKIIPPTPVIGSFLVELRREDGEPMANAKVGMLGKGEEEAPPSALTSFSFWLGTGSAQIIYETEADQFGLVALPINKISSNQLDLKIQDAGRVFLSRFMLPSDFANAVSQLRVNGGLPPLPDYPAEPQPAGTTAASSEALLSEQKVALQLPEDSAAAASSGETPTVTEPQVFSLPVSTGTAEKTFDIYPEVYNASVGTAARFAWQNSFTSNADVRIAYSYSEASLSSWDGKLSSVPDLSASRDGINFVTDYSACTDDGFRTQASGPLKAVDDSRCGFLRSEFPFSDGSDVFVRVAGESETTIKLSRVFRVGFSEVTLSSAAVSENAPVGTEVGTLAVSNSDGASFSYQLSGADASAFTIEADRLKTSRVFDFEGQRNYAVTITSVRFDGDTLSKNFIIKVTNVNEAPFNLTVSSIVIAENLPAGSLVGNLSAADYDDNETFQYILSGTDAAEFVLSAGKLLTSSKFNFEQKSSYEIDVIAIDSGGLSVSKAIAIAVANVNESSTDIVISSNSILENSPSGTTVGMLSTVDEDVGSIFTYSLEGSDKSFFEVANGTLKSKSVFNFELKKSYSLLIISRDQAGQFFSKPMNIQVTNVNEAPSDIVLSNNVIDEDQSAGTEVGSLSIVDPDLGDTFTYSVGGADGGLFEVVNGKLVTKSVLDAGVKSSHSIQVNVLDSGGLSFSKSFTISVIKKSFAPTDIVLSQSSVDENGPSGSLVGTLSSIDPDGDTAFTYTLGGADASSFVLEGSSLKTAASFNYEGKKSYALSITTADPENLAFTKNFTIDVLDINEPPSNISLSAATVLENRPAGTVIGTVSVTDPDTGSIFSYTLDVGDGAAFEITDGKLVTKAPLNFEQKGSYAIDIMVADQGGLQTLKSFSIAVIDVKEAPTDIILSANSILENNAIGTEIGTLSTADSDIGNTHTYTLAGTDSNAFEVVNGKLRAKAIFNFELKSSYNFFVTTTDQDNLSFTKPLTVMVGNLIEAPADIVLSKTSVAENLEAGALVGVLSLLQPDLGSTYAYTLGGTDGSSFEVVGNNLVTKATFDFEIKSSYAVTITATDQNNLFSTKPFTLTVTNVSEPISDIVLSSTTVNENVSVGSTVATLTGINQEVGAIITYSLSGADAATFAISGSNTLVVAAPINFEAKSSYSLTITGRDQNSLSFTKAVTLTVVNQNESPTDITLSANTVSELATSGTTIGTLATTDPDASNTFTYSLSGADAGLFSVTGSVLKTAGVLNFEGKSSYTLSVTSTDQGSLSVSKSITIQITDANEAPTDVTLANSTVAENSTVVGLVSAVDPDAGNTFTYSLVGTDAAAFAISGGMLVFQTPADFETQNSYAVTIVARDQNDLSFSKNFSIQVTNVNEAPTNLTLSANTISENSLVGSVVGVFTPTDPDLGDTFTYTLGGADAGSFSIVSGNLVSIAAVNFETKSSYAIAVTLKDQGDLSLTMNFTVTVTNVNEAPTNITLSATAVDENLPSGTVVGLISASDPDFGNTHTYTLSGADSASFTIAGASLKTAISFNFEIKNSYSLTLRATDQGGLFYSKNFTVTVNNVDEPSTDILLSSTSIGENLAIGTTVGTLSTLDPDTGSQFTYTLSGTDASSFSLVGDALQSAEIFNAATKSSYLITVTSTVQSGLFISKNFTINVGSGAVAPTDILLSRNTVWENGGANAVVGTLSAVDADTLPANMTFSLVAGTGDTDNAKFNISGSTLRATASLDYEVQDIYSLRVRAADPEGGAFERIFAVQAVDVFEDPYFDNVVLLAHLEGSPGNTTFVDSSKLRKTLTQVNTGGHDFSNSKFGVTSLRSSASGYVDAGIVNFPDGTDFTMEGWWYRTLDNVNGIKGLFITETASNAQCRIAVQEGTGTLSLVTSSSNFYYTNFIIGSSSAAQLSVPLNTWHHVAYTRNGSMLRIFLNGVLVKSVSGSDCFSNNGYLRFARNVSGGDAGYFDEFRVTMGVARYTADFVAPTTPFPDENPPTFIPSVLGTTYTQSSVNASSTAAQSSFLTDGTILGNVAATNAEASSGWIKVDFKRPYLIDRVIVGTSNSSAASPLADKSLTENKTVEYSIDGTNWSFAFNTGTLPALGIYKFDVDFHARYLRIKNTSASSDILSVSEFYALSPGQNYTAGAFTPIKAYPVVWYDSSDAASISLDNATSAAPAVLGWADKAYWKRHLSQASASNRPSITRNFVNGRNTLVWPSTDNDKFLENSSSVTVSEVYAVGRFAGPSTTNFSNTESILAPRNNSLSSWLTAVGSSTQFNPTIFNLMFLNAVNSLNRIDNVFPEMSNLSLIRATTEFASATSTNGITVGIDRLQTALGRGWKGEISELILYSPPLSATDRASVESYLKTKWNLP